MKRVSLGDVLTRIWKNVFIIIISIAVFATASYFIAKKYSKPSYSVSGQVMLYHGHLNKFDNLSGDIAMMPTYAHVITDSKIINEVDSNLSQHAGYHYTADELTNMVLATPAADSVVMTISVTNVDNKKMAIDIVNEVRNVTKKRLNNIAGAGNVRILGPIKDTNVETKTVFSKSQIMEIGLILGLLVGGLIAAIKGANLHAREEH
ncbi:Wzz/FepE/Etk N-terminal domain-containing protein [Lactiplantibacillus pingfangensis]|uniref:Wzz/FepE/Etk N-terminal domain-containing protein n=1 Tax=Lactiplantibacillus pingfangensis TaxID=2559915 RepID=UPI0010F8507A|nr:Wzz/FepE/Etk N-terminal domain-containing protein [Lactiplantibacillus pingfangensis]